MSFTKDDILKINKRVYDSTVHVYDCGHKHSIFCAENQKRVEKILEYIIKDY